MEDTPGWHPRQCVQNLSDNPMSYFLTFASRLFSIGGAGAHSLESQGSLLPKAVTLTLSLGGGAVLLSDSCMRLALNISRMNPNR